MNNKHRIMIFIIYSHAILNDVVKWLYFVKPTLIGEPEAGFSLTGK
jgi:hypothetical protein